MFAKVARLDLIFLRCLIFTSFLAVVFTVLSPYFLSSSNFDNVLSAATVIGLLAFGMTFVIAAGEIDLSVASVMALSATVSALLLRDGAISTLTALLLCAAVGGAVGALTGTLVNFTQAPSFIVTLGMLSVTRAAAFFVADGIPIYGLPDGVTALGQGEFKGVSVPILFLVGAAVITFAILHGTRFGLRLLVLGDNPRAAEQLGLSRARLRVGAFALCGLLAGVAGFIFMARTNCGDPTAGQSYELVAITAVVLGGAKLFGGRASIIGTFLGVLCLGVLQNGLNLLAVSTYYQVLFVGAVLLLAAALERAGER